MRVGTWTPVDSQTLSKDSHPQVGHLQVLKARKEANRRLEPGGTVEPASARVAVRMGEQRRSQPGPSSGRRREWGRGQAAGPCWAGEGCEQAAHSQPHWESHRMPLRVPGREVAGSELSHWEILLQQGTHPQCQHLPAGGLSCSPPPILLCKGGVDPGGPRLTQQRTIFVIQPQLRVLGKNKITRAQSSLTQPEELEGFNQKHHRN